MANLSDGLVETAAQFPVTCDRRIYGVTVAKVINNVDSTGLGRVQVHLPWLPGIEPWARVARLDQGTYFIPQIGDEVLLAFNHGDIREPYVMGSVWNAQDRPPASGPEDPVTKRIIRTPIGHQMEFDDLTGSITITTSSGQKVTIDPTKIELATSDGTASASLDTSGNVSVRSKRRIEMKAPHISIEGNTVEIKSNTRTGINGGQACDIQAALVKIN